MRRPELRDKRQVQFPRFFFILLLFILPAGNREKQKSFYHEELRYTKDARDSSHGLVLELAGGDAGDDRGELGAGVPVVWTGRR